MIKSQATVYIAKCKDTLEIQCRTKARDDRIKNQKKEQIKGVVTVNEDDFRIVSRRKESKAQQNQNDTQINQNKTDEQMTNEQKQSSPNRDVERRHHNNIKRGISIKEREANPKSENPGNPWEGKEKVGNENHATNMNQQDGKNLENGNKKKERIFKSKQSKKEINLLQKSTVKPQQNSVYQKGEVGGIKNNKIKILGRRTTTNPTNR